MTIDEVFGYVLTAIMLWLMLTRDD
jgi:hypothetical protein